MGRRPMKNGHCPAVGPYGLKVSMHLGAGVGSGTGDTKMVAQSPSGSFWFLFCSLALTLATERLQHSSETELSRDTGRLSVNQGPAIR